MAPRTTGYLRAALNECTALVVLEAEVETMRASYGDEAVGRAMRRVAEQAANDAKRSAPNR